MEYKKINELCSTITSNLQINKLENNNGVYELYGASGLVKKIDFYKIDKPYISIVKDGAGVGRIDIHNAKSSIVGTLQAFVNNDNVNLKYLYYALKNQKLDKTKTGATIPHIYFKDYGNNLVKFYPLEKQREIVSILDKINAIIDADKKQLELLDEIVKSRFIEMFDSIDKKVPLKEICSIAGGYSFKSTDICNDGIKLLQIGNVALNDLDWSTTNYLPVGFEKQRPNFLLKEDDIVVALTRPIIQSLGNVKACIVKQEDLPCLLNQRVGKIQCIDGKSVVDYIFGCLMTEDFTEYVKSCCIGCSQPNISTKDIESYQVPNVNIESQLAFRNFKELIDKSKFNIQQHLNLMQELLDKKMDEYFGGTC